MDWTQIIISALSLLAAVFGGVGLGRLLFLRQNRKKANAEATSAEVGVLKSAIESIDQQLSKAHLLIREKDEIIEAKNARIDLLTSTISALYDDMCVHKGCRLRRPHQGQGAKWYEQYRDDPSLGCDYLSIDTLIKQERAKRLAENILAKEAAEETAEGEE